MEMISDMLKKNPDDSFLRYAAALEHKKAGENEIAIELLEVLIRKNPDYLAAYYQLGKLFEDKGQAHIAIRHYKNGKELAVKANDKKTMGELSEALLILDADEEF